MKNIYLLLVIIKIITNIIDSFFIYNNENYYENNVKMQRYTHINQLRIKINKQVKK